jgi:hypothetical protein
MKILSSIAHADEETRIEQSEQREQLRRDALHMLKQFQQQMRLEKEKEQELDAMFQLVFFKYLKYIDILYYKEKKLLNNGHVVNKNGIKKKNYVKN